jgi:hypothetical protein
MHYPCQIAHPEWSSSADTDPHQSQISRINFLGQFSDTPTHVIGTHFAGPTAGCLVKVGNHYWLDAHNEAARFRVI